MSSMYSVGQMNQLANALEVAEFSSDDVTKLGQFTNLSDLRGIFRGTHELRIKKHVIDCDAEPFCSFGWKVKEHKKGGQLEWDVSKIKLYLSKNQRGDSCIKGNKLHKELANKLVLNANILDYLLKNPQLISEEWKSKYVFFWGTIYRHSSGRVVVRYLDWYGVEWGWSYFWLGESFCDARPAALLLNCDT